MKKTIQREAYMAWLAQFRDKPLIKVLTGMRRVGKSTIMRMFAQGLRREGVPASRIVMVNFEELENAPLRTAEELHRFIVGKLARGGTTYVFLDEIQRVEHYEEVLDSLYVKKGVDLYVTGSTADLFSSEIATLLTGRYVEMNVLPFSFLEMTKAVGGKVGDAAEKRRFMDYLTYGSLPESFAFKTGSSEQREYVESVYRTILEKDVLKRNKEGGRLLVGQMLKYMASAISSLTSPKRMADRLKANGVKVSANTVSSYLDILEDCYFIYKADRFDVKGGEMLKLINKYYLTDFGFRYYTLSNPDIEIQQLLENAVFLELLRRRYKVATGKVDEREVDFVVKGSNDLLCYIQVAVTVAEKEKYSQEVAAFKSIRDNYPKLILTLDDIFIENRNGIQMMNVIDFITGRCTLPV